MTILATSLQHFFAGTSRFRRRAHLIPAPASADTTLRIGPESGRRVEQQRPIRNYWRQPDWQPHSPPTPLTRQIPIDGKPLASSRGFVLQRLSDAGLGTGLHHKPSRHPKPLHDSRLRALSPKRIGPTPKLRFATRALSTVRDAFAGSSYPSAAHDRSTTRPKESRGTNSFVEPVTKRAFKKGPAGGCAWHKRGVDIRDRLTFKRLAGRGGRTLAPFLS
jgi:hypothetical protein